MSILHQFFRNFVVNEFEVILRDKERDKYYGFYKRKLKKYIYFFKLDDIILLLLRFN